MHTIEETVQRGICIGCGACSAATGGAVRVTLSRTRLYNAHLDEASDMQIRAASRVCPFSDESPNEDVLRSPKFDPSMNIDDRLGAYTRTFAGRVADEEYLKGSSSGGLTSWLIDRLIAEGHADAVINVGAGAPGKDAHSGVASARAISEELFSYAVSTRGEALAMRKSHYYATSLSDVLRQVEENPKRYVIVGVPCFIRATRALCRENVEFDKRIVFFVSLVCGHFKTQSFAESLAWQIGVPPWDLATVDFRVKRSERAANDYDFSAQSASSGQIVSAPMRSLAGGNWGHGAFQPEACNFCDDVVGETGDVSFGDAWSPRFTGYPLGTNVVISRNPKIDSIFDSGESMQTIQIFPASAEEIADTQAGGFRHRREGLAVRLADDIRGGLSVPHKRVSARGAASVPARRIRLIRQRRLMAAQSHESFLSALEKRELSLYLDDYRRDAFRYRRFDLSWIQRTILLAKTAIRKILRRLGTPWTDAR